MRQHADACDAERLRRCADASQRSCRAGGRIDAVAVQGGNLYGEMKDAGFVVPAVRPGLVDAAFHRANVAYSTREAPGTIVVDPAGHYLYYVEAGGRATRYGIGVGRDGFAWSGKRRSRASRNGPTGIRQRK